MLGMTEGRDIKRGRELELRGDFDGIHTLNLAKWLGWRRQERSSLQRRVVVATQQNKGMRESIMIMKRGGK